MTLPGIAPYYILLIGTVTFNSNIDAITGGLKLATGVQDVAEIITTGALTINGISVEGLLNVDNTNITATGSYSIGEICGVVNFEVLLLNDRVGYGSFEKTFYNGSGNIGLGSVVLYTF